MFTLYCGLQRKFLEDVETTLIVGFLSKIFGSTASKSESKELTLAPEELESWLNNRRKEEFESILRKGDEFGREMAKVSKNLVDMGSELASATIKESKQIKELNANVQSAKSTMAKKLVTAFSSIEPWSLGTFDEMRTAQTDVSQILKSVTGVIKAHGRYVTFFFKDDLRRIQFELGKMEKLSADMAKLISENKGQFDEITDLIEDAKRYSNVKTSTRTEKTILAEINKSVTASQRDLKDLLSKINEVEQTTGFKASSGTKIKIDGLESELSKLQARFDTDLNRLNKPLRKYLYSASLSKAQKTLTDNYLRSPATTLLSDSDLVILPILNDLKQGLGNILGNPKQSEKMNKHVEELVSSLPDTRRQLLALSKQIDDHRAISSTDEMKKHGNLNEENLRQKKILEEQLNRVKQLASKIEQDETVLKGISTQIEAKVDELFSVRIDMYRN